MISMKDKKARRLRRMALAGDALQITGSALQDAFGSGAGGRVQSTLGRIDARKHNEAALQEVQAQHAASQQEQLAKAQAEQQRQDQLSSLVQQSGLGARGQLAALTAPDELGKQVASNFAAANVGAGDSRLVNGQFVTAPEAAFTLSQGQTRFGADGAPVASVDAKPELSFEQQLQLRSAGANKTTINTGDGSPGSRPIVDKPDKGFQRIFDEESGTYRDIPIPGSSSSRDLEAENIKAFKALESSNIQFDTMKTNIDEAKKLLGPWTAGYGGLLRNLPASSQRQLRNRLATVQSNIGFDKLQEMRENSPTGGALGQVSEREIDFLQATRGKIDQLTDPKQLLESLDEVEASLGRLQEIRQVAYELEHGSAQGEQRPQITPTTSTPLPEGFQVSEEDIQHTMQIHGMTREQVLQKLGGQ